MNDELSDLSDQENLCFKAISSAYQRGVVFGRNHCDKNTPLTFIRDYVAEKSGHFVKLARLLLEDIYDLGDKEA